MVSFISVHLYVIPAKAGIYELVLLENLYLLLPASAGVTGIGNK